MLKTLKYIVNGTFYSLVVVGGYTTSIAGFIDVFSSTGYIAVLKFIVFTLVLAATSFIAWFIGYTYDNAHHLGRKRVQSNGKVY